MSGVVRRIQSDAEFDAYLRAASYAFHTTRDEALLERYRAMYRPEWCLGTFDGTTLVAGLTIIPFEHYMMGARIPFGGIATVATLPEHRRSGHVGALLRGALQEMRDAGQALSGLYTPHFSLYRKYGWEIASRVLSYSFAPKVVSPRRSRPNGTFERVGADDWARLAHLRDQFVMSRNGALSRDEDRWRGIVLSDNHRRDHDAVIWSNSASIARGYAVFAQDRRPTPRPSGETVLRIVDWVALDGDAYASLLHFLLSHDLASRIVINTSEDEPMAALLAEPSLVQEPHASYFGMMLRVVDLGRALSLRPALPEAEGVGVCVRVLDETAPWNAGVWSIAASGGNIRAELTHQAPEIELNAASLGPLYNGFLRPEDAARAGMLTADSEEPLRRLGRILAVSARPFCADDF